MATKLWGCDPSGLSADLARRRISVNGGGRLLRRVARGARPAGRTFLYPRLGYGEVVDRLAGSAVVAGARIETGRPWTCSSQVGRCSSRSTTGGRSSPDRVLWTAPLDALVGVVPVPRTLHHRATGASCSSTSCSTRIVTATSTRTTSRIPTSHSPASRSRRTTATARTRRPHRALRRGAGDRRRHVLGGERRRHSARSCSTAWSAPVGLRRPRSPASRSSGSPRLPDIPVDDVAAAAAPADGPTPRSSLRPRPTGPRRRRQPPSRLAMALDAVACLGPDGWDAATGRPPAPLRHLVVDD